MNKSIIFVIILIINSTITVGQVLTEISIPKFDDEYSKTVENLELGQTDIDYKKFRESFIESEQFKIALKKSTELSELEKEMYRHMSNSKFDSIITITKKMLSIDYTNMTAHKILRQSFEIIGDTLNAKKYKEIQFGLLKSIVTTGDGKSCQTAWSVIQVSEEYFILDMLGAELYEQSIYNYGGICDKMDVNINGEKRTYYFEISKVFEGRKNIKSK